jgi:hypothetical protein
MKRRKQQVDLFLNTLESLLKQRFYSDAEVRNKIENLKNLDANVQLLPFSAAKDLVDRFFKT